MSDPKGAAVPAAHISITNTKDGQVRALDSSDEGSFRAPALPAGVYRVSADAQGFERFECEAIVDAGMTTTVNLEMKIGAAKESVTVNAVSPQLERDSHEIDGVITRAQISSLPLNGRSFLELAKLEPGAQQPTRASNNRTFVPLLGSPIAQNGRATRVTVDGGSIMEIGNGGTAIGISQEVIEEFQVSTANFDLTTGATASGAVNIVTRSGGNDFHGSVFYFYRDHNLAAYPALKRDPASPDPFFQRQQFGGAAGGPVRRGRAYFFGTYERNNQRGVISTQLLTLDFAPLSRITQTPFFSNQFSLRLDLRLKERNSLFVRETHEGLFSYAPTTLTPFGSRAYPSAWTEQRSYADQSILGLTSELSPRVVNDFRFSYFFVSSAERAPTSTDCSGCLGVDAPSISIRPDFFIGTSLTTAVLGRRFHLNDSLDWVKGTHELRFGGDWETTRGGRVDDADNPATITLFAPKDVRNFDALHPGNQRIPIPATFVTLADILQLPVQSFSVGIGDPKVPQANFGNTRVATLIHPYFVDSWRTHAGLVFNYGLAWTYDAPLNYDLKKPLYLEPLLGASGLAPTRRNWKEFSPSAGFAWSPRNDGKTVIRGGAGIYYDFQSSFGSADAERVSLGPQGIGRGSYFSGGIPNPLTNVPGVPQGTFLAFTGPTFFTGADLMQALPVIQSSLDKRRGDPNNQDFAVTNIQADKQGSVVATTMPSSSATHISIGVQREIRPGFVISADFVYRYFKNTSPPQVIDLNHFPSGSGPILPVCTPAQQLSPQALCSLGPILLSSGIGSAHYEGLLVRVEKRFSGRWQLLGSYANSSDIGNSFTVGFNNNSPLEAYGPLDRDFHHILNLSGIAQLPLHIQLAAFLTYLSRPPFSAILGPLDLNGDGNTGDLLPGTAVNEFNRGLTKSDLLRLVNSFNKTFAGKFDSLGTTIPPISLPSSFEFGDPFLTQDVRVSREFAIRESYRLTLIVEAFNVFNVANLSGRSGDLLGAGFGQPTSRVNQAFGSGGPRSLQLAARFSF